MEPTPKSLILDLLSTVGRGSAPVRALVSAGALFGLAENSVRVALARLLSDGLVERDARGRYRIGPGAAPVNEQIRGWKRIEERLERWSGDWVAVHTSAAPRRGGCERRRTARALRLQGFRPLAPGLELRPDNLVGGVASLRDRLVGLGLAPELPVCGLRQLDATWEERARALWNGEELVKAYRSTCRRVTESSARLPDLPREAAMAESFSLGGAAIRQLVFDPLLPEPIVPAAERRALVAAMRRYDLLGRRIWAGWLGDGATAPADLPAGVRGPRQAADDLESPRRS